ncbi:uncharacterized protein [Gossypium hirsutum]|uniref:Uncharacterized protein isoform X19 n=1 Tax=Gossypium hirsutum TaxID=3635 RepID=A0A1U8JP75_GOSHI|nr:uncharacterized protein LOC107909094 isoform X19 [Gossypium hirsutum]
MLVLLPWLSLTHAHSDTSAVSLPYRFIRLCTTGPGSHKLFHILTNAPLPTFHLMPCFSNFWALQILRQIAFCGIGRLDQLEDHYNNSFSVVSKIVVSGPQI